VVYLIVTTISSYISNPLEIYLNFSFEREILRRDRELKLSRGNLVERRRDVTEATWA